MHELGHSLGLSHGGFRIRERVVNLEIKPQKGYDGKIELFGPPPPDSLEYAKTNQPVFKVRFYGEGKTRVRSLHLHANFFKYKGNHRLDALSFVAPNVPFKIEFANLRGDLRGKNVITLKRFELDLEHGNYHPNHFSVMNYTWGEGIGPDKILDYQSVEMPSLDESRLNELDGLGAGYDALRVGYPNTFRRFESGEIDPLVIGDQDFRGSQEWKTWSVDWNQNRIIEENPKTDPDDDFYGVDLDGDGHLEIIGPKAIEWRVLRFRAGAIGVKPLPSFVIPPIIPN